ncbi:hypothetical protein Tco_1008489 [Tanacetum coccineum]
MVISSPCLTDIKNWLVQSKRLLSAAASARAIRLVHDSCKVTSLILSAAIERCKREKENTQNSKKTLEGTSGSEGDQVQLPHDSPLSGGHTSDRVEGGLNLDELFVLCTNLSNRGRKNAKPGPTLDDIAFDNLDADLAHGMDYMDKEEAVNEGRQSKDTEEQNVTHDTYVLEKGGNNEEPVNAAGNIRVSTVVPEVSTVNISTASRPEVSTATPMTPPTTTSVFDNEDITLAETLVKMKDDKAKLKGVAIKEVEESDRPVMIVN